MRGTPQGGVASPLLANVYMNRFLKYWRLTAVRGSVPRHVITYADDFVILIADVRLRLWRGRRR